MVTVGSNLSFLKRHTKRKNVKIMYKSHAAYSHRRVNEFVFAYDRKTESTGKKNIGNMTPSP